jgi:hypothetical protein
MQQFIYSIWNFFKGEGISGSLDMAQAAAASEFLALLVLPRDGTGVVLVILGSRLSDLE